MLEGKIITVFKYLHHYHGKKIMQILMIQIIKVNVIKHTSPVKEEALTL